MVVALVSFVQPALQSYTLLLSPVAAKTKEKARGKDNQLLWQWVPHKCSLYSQLHLWYNHPPFTSKNKGRRHVIYLNEELSKSQRSFILPTTSTYLVLTSTPYFNSWDWDPASIQTCLFWIPVRCSYQLSHWSSGIAAEGIRYISIDTCRSILRLDFL